MLFPQYLKIILSYTLSLRTPFRRLPWLGGQYLDLYLLYRKVTLAGGWVKVGDSRVLFKFYNGPRRFFRLTNH